MRRPVSAALAFVIALFVALVLVGAPAGAQDNPTTAIDQARTELENVKTRLKDANLQDEDLDALRAKVEPMNLALEGAIAQLQPQLDQANARVAQIGEKPKDGEPDESPEVVKERETQIKARQEVDEAIKRGRLIQVESQQVATQIAERRRSALAERLAVKSRSLLEPGLWVDVAREFPRDLGRLSAGGSEVARAVSSNLGPRSGALVGGAIVLAALLLFPIRRFLQDLGERLVIKQAPQSRLRRSVTALLRLLASTLAPALAAFLLYWALKLAGWLPQRFDRFAVATVYASGFLGFTHGMMKALLAPGRPSWRLIDISDAAIAEIKNQPLWVATGFVLGRLFHHLNEAVGASLAVVIATSGVFAVINAVTFAIALRRLDAARRVEERLAGDGEDGKSKLASPVFSILKLFAWGAVVIVLGSVAVGYVAFAQFLANQVIWISAVFALAYLALIVVDDLFTTGLSAETTFGRGMAGAIGVRTESLEQVGVVLSGFVRLFLLGIAALFVLAPWGLQSTDIFGWLRYAVTGVELGGIRLSLPGVLGAVALVMLGFALTRAVQRWLDRDLLPKTRMDDGLKSSVSVGVGYLGVVLVIMIAVSYLGFGLSNLAIVAGALSVGIGFGLQAVISNFVSGVILLAERPIKAGDWIVIGTDQGNVRRISVRSTEIELFDRSTLIVPNSDFITKSVKNVTHGAPNGRVRIDLAVSSAIDPQEVKRIVVETAKSHGSVISFPEPQFLFLDLGKSDNLFQLNAYVPSPRQAASVKSDLNFMLTKAFAQAGVPLAGPEDNDMVVAVRRVAEALGAAGSGAGRPISPGEHDAADAPPEAAEEPAAGKPADRER